MSEKKNNSEFLEIPKRQLSIISGGLFLLAAFTFAAGYFLGTNHAVESFMLKAEQDSFADQVYASLSALYDQDISPAKEVEAEKEIGESLDQQEDACVDIPLPKSLPVVQVPQAEQAPKAQFSLLEIKKPVNQESAVVTSSAEPAVDTQQSFSPNPVDGGVETKVESKKEEVITKPKKSVDSFELVKNDRPNKKWYAQLIGYGLEKPARDFAQKLTKKGFEVAVATRKSRTAKGNQRTWYQVVTAAYDDRDLLQKQVDKIVSLEKLKGVQITIC